MKPEYPTNVHNIQACHRLANPNFLPYLLTHESFTDSQPGSWCTRAIGMELVVYLGGTSVFRTPEIVNHMQRGSVCLVPSDVYTRHIPVSGSLINYWNFLFIEDKMTLGDLDLTKDAAYQELRHFQGDGLNRISQVFYLDNELLNEIETLGNEILTAQAFSSRGWKYHVASAFLYLLGRIVHGMQKNHPESESPEDKVAKVISYIERNCSHPLELNKLAQMAGMSPSSFSHHFTRIRGISPIEFVIRCRVQKAISMFAYCRNITQIAVECGFDELPYFSKIFRLRTGFTPTLFKGLSQEEQMGIARQLRD